MARPIQPLTALRRIRNAGLTPQEGTLATMEVLRDIRLRRGGIAEGPYDARKEERLARAEIRAMDLLHDFGLRS